MTFFQFIVKVYEFSIYMFEKKYDILVVGWITAWTSMLHLYCDIKSLLLKEDSALNHTCLFFFSTKQCLVFFHSEELVTIEGKFKKDLS